jgi:hypothetical protein
MLLQFAIMSTTSKSTFAIKDWKDTPSGDIGSESELTLTKAVHTYTGGIVGEGVAEFLMCAGADGTTHFIGFERITGALDGKTGSFVIQHEGVFAGEPRSTWKILIGSGNGDLAGISGSGSYGVKDGVVEFVMTYVL